MSSEKLTARRLTDTAQRGEWGAYDARGRLVCVRKTRKEALEQGARYASPEALERAQRSDRISFIERLEALGE